MSTNATRRHRRSRGSFSDAGSTTGVATATLALVSAGALATLGLVTAGEIAGGGSPDRFGTPRSVQPPDGVVVADDDAEQPGGTSGGGQDNSPQTGTGPTIVPFLPFLPPSLGGLTPSGTASPDNGPAVPDPSAAPGPDLASAPPAGPPAPVVVLADKHGKSAFSPGHTKPGGTAGRAEGRAVGRSARDVAEEPRPTLAAAGHAEPTSGRDTAPGRLRHAEGGRPANPSRGRSVPTAPAVPVPAAQPPAQPAAHEPPGLAKGHDKH